VERILAQALGQDLGTLAAQEKQLLLSRLLSRLAHEIRNPLSSLDVHVQLLEEDLRAAAPDLRERTASRFEILHGELHRLENLVQQFVSLAGPSALHLQPVDIGRTLRHVCELLRPEADARGIRLTQRAAPELAPIQADPAQLTQALVNLVINALQALEGPGRVELEATSDPVGQELVVAVRDTGAGVPAGRRSAIFEPYFTTKPEGSGLGLWIVQQIATAHGGAVSVEDAPGGGAVFRLRLPWRTRRPSDG
jgi:two-component system sensor histidine kinase HydH